MNNIDNLSIGKKAPEVVNAVIETPKGSHNKYEYDVELGVMALNRVLSTPVRYPIDYGFIPETHSEDGDHLDIIIIGSDPVFPGCVVDARPVGLLKMIDSGETDFKILAVQQKNPRLSHIKNLNDVEMTTPHLLKEIEHFFRVYKDLEGKKVELHGWGDVDAAHAEIKKAQEAFVKNK